MLEQVKDPSKPHTIWQPTTYPISYFLFPLTNYLSFKTPYHISTHPTLSHIYHQIVSLCSCFIPLILILLFSHHLDPFIQLQFSLSFLSNHSLTQWSRFENEQWLESVNTQPLESIWNLLLLWLSMAIQCVEIIIVGI